MEEIVDTVTNEQLEREGLKQAHLQAEESMELARVRLEARERYMKAIPRKKHFRMVPPELFFHR